MGQVVKYRANKVVDLFGQIKNGSSYEEIQNLLAFAVPDVTLGSSELNGAGMIGPVNVTDPSNIEAMEASITTSDDSGNAALLNDPNGVELVLNWAVDKVGTDGSSEYIAHRAVIKGYASVIPGGEKKKGEAAEIEHKISVWYYKEEIDGKEVTLVDKFAPKCVINGVDLLEKLNKALSR
ncbi:MAG: phage major tail tube protein [Lachnospiraceae bacterium]